MKKSEFKKMMKKENKSFKSYYLCEMIIILLVVAMVTFNVLLMVNDRVPVNVMIIQSVLTIIMAIPTIVIDIKNDMEINKIYKVYLKENKVPEYKAKTKSLIIVLVITIVILIINAFVTIPNITRNDSYVEESLEITSQSGLQVSTKYESFDGFKIKIPTSFEIMSDEIVKVKYPNGNVPSVVYTNDDTTINVAVVLSDANMKNSEIKKYMKSMEAMYDNTKINFFERNGHTVGETEFVTSAVDTDIYNHIIAFSVNGKLRLVNFNCTKNLMDKWQEISDFVINSIVFE